MINLIIIDACGRSATKVYKGLAAASFFFSVCVACALPARMATGRSRPCVALAFPALPRGGHGAPSSTCIDGWLVAPGLAAVMVTMPQAYAAALIVSWLRPNYRLGLVGLMRRGLPSRAVAFNYYG